MTTANEIDAQSEKALYKVLASTGSSSRIIRPSEVLKTASDALRTALENACIAERRATLRAASDPKDRKPYDSYVQALEDVDDKASQFLALEGHIMRVRVLSNERDIEAIEEEIRKERNSKKSNYHPSTSSTIALMQRLADAVPTPIDAISLSIRR
jgi:hypothetical protein